MEQRKIESADVNECENGLDSNWNERKHLIDEEFELRLEIQELLVKGDRGFEGARERERVCKDALRRNEEEYERLVTTWGAEVLAT